MTQLSSTASICATQRNMWLVKIFSVIYFTAVCAAQDPKNVTTALPMSMEITTIYDSPVPSLQLLSDWPDVFPSEKVELSCIVTGSSDWIFSWYKNTQKLQDPDPDPNVSAEGSKLTITDATSAYSGSYSCKGHHKTSTGRATQTSNLVEVRVHANNPKPTLTRSSNFGWMFPGESVDLTCKVDVSSGWNYLWYHNKTEIQAFNNKSHTTVSIDHSKSGQYHCKAKRGKGPFYTEDSDTTTLRVSDPPQPSLTLLSPWPDVFVNETVEFNCQVESSDWMITWYKNGEKLQEDDNMEIVDSSFNISEVIQANQGGYACKAELESRRVSSGFSNTFQITVYENIPKATRSKVPAFIPMYVGETVNFTCKVAESFGWAYQWYRNDTQLSDGKQTISVRLDLSDQGKYWCMAHRGGTTTTGGSKKIQQDVLEIPAPSLKLITPWLDVFPTESVKLSCKINDSSDWTYTWYKDEKEVQTLFDSKGTTLTISSASTADIGKYNCKGHLNKRSVSSRLSSGLSLKVYDKKPEVILTQDPEYNVMFPGESVSFSCHINVSIGWEYLWYQDTNPLTASGNKYPIKSVGTTNMGSYTCNAKRGSDQNVLAILSQPIRLEVKGKKPKPSMTQQPDVDKVYAGESVSFKCEVNLSSGWVYHWYQNGSALPFNNSSLIISDANLSNSGTYSCMAMREKTMYNTEHSVERILRVSEIPVPSLKLITPWLDVFPTESVKFSCRMDGTSDWTYVWFKDGQQVQADNTVSFDSDAATLSISFASASHHGQYSCLGKLKSRSVSSISSSEITLTVYDTKPRVTLMQNPIHNVMYTGDSVTFSCHINVSSGWEYLWHKDGSLLALSGNNHNISSVVRTNTGSYQCQVQRGNTIFHSDQSQAVKLDVKKRPKANIVLLTGWSEVFSTESLELKCGIQESQDMWNYTWFKEGKPINQADNLLPSEKYSVTPQNDPEQSLYTCQGIRAGRPSYSESSDSFKTRSLLLKRRLLLAISGCIFFGIIAVFLGCIACRVFRKPAVGEEKPEVAELFLTMAQLKDRDDAPCPLVQYITDAELNASSKEQENGTICSETTPLPITSLEDQGVTSESRDTTENNGGLISFKQ